MNIPYQTGRSLYQIKLFPVGAHEDFFFEAGAHGFDKPAFGFSGVNGKLYDDLGLFFGSYSNKEIDIDVSYIGQNGSPCATITRCNGQIFTNRQRNSAATYRLRSEAPISRLEISGGADFSCTTYGESRDFEGATVYYSTTGSENDALISDFLAANLSGVNAVIETGTFTGIEITGLASPLCIILGTDIKTSDFYDSFGYSNIATPILVMDCEVAGHTGLGLITGGPANESFSYGKTIDQDSHYSQVEPRIFKNVPARFYPLDDAVYNWSAGFEIAIYGRPTSGLERGRYEIVTDFAEEPLVISFTGGESCLSGIAADKRVLLNIGEFQYTGLHDDGKSIILNCLAWLLG